MSLHDFRTKPNTEWTYYVVDHLPTMNNIYRFDTVQEAIDKYRSLPETQKSAIGSSLHNKHEIDHIHRADGQSILVRDMDRMKDPLWRDSEEIGAAVALMRSQLNVQFELSSIFGSFRHSVGVPVVESNPGYSTIKHLDPKNPEHPLSAINEVHVTGRGWVSADTFLDDLDNLEWSRENGYPIMFVNQLNVRYIDEHNRCGQMDVLPHQFEEMCKEHTKLREQEMQRISSALPDVCYAVHPTTGSLTMIKKWVDGYHSCPLSTTSERKNKELASQYNTKLGVSQAQVKAMEFGSRYGWDKHGADPKVYEKPSLQEKISDAEAKSASQSSKEKNTPEKAR